MSDCIFCRIVKGELSAVIVHESPEAVAFLDKYPVARGHVVVIPRAHAKTLPALEDDAVGGLFRAVKEVMRKVEAALRPRAMNVGWNHGAGAGQVVPHLHVHVLPRHGPPGRGVQVMGEGTDRVDFAALGAALRDA